MPAHWRDHLPRVTLAALVCGVLLVVAGCGQPEGDQGQARQIEWQPRRVEVVPDEVRQWVEEQKAELGIFPETFGDETFILVSWGERTTGGYAVEVTDVALVGPRRLRLHVRLHEPGSGDAVTQAITYPYALISVRPAGHYHLDPVFEGATFLKNEAFEIVEPLPFAEVADRVRLRGKARVFEATFMVNMGDGHVVLAEQPVMASEGAPGWGDFDVEITLDGKPTSPNGWIVVYEPSAKDGTPLHRLIIPVRFADWD